LAEQQFCPELVAMRGTKSVLARGSRPRENRPLSIVRVDAYAAPQLIQPRAKQVAAMLAAQTSDDATQYARSVGRFVSVRRRACGTPVPEIPFWSPSTKQTDQQRKPLDLAYRVSRSQSASTSEEWRRTPQSPDDMDNL
jgi:hypothetical protein